MSIQRIHDRLSAGHKAAQDDAGLSMTEVITALFVFTIFILGLGYSLLSMTRLVGDDENREVAAALASQEMDRVRAVPDAFDVTSVTSTQTVNGTVFTIKRIAGWVTTNGSATSCGTGGGNLQDKAVDVQVTWNKQYVKTSPIRSTTILAPSTRINDPNYGTIIVSVLGGDGTGRGNLPVTITAVSGGAVTPSAVDPTDGSGCSYTLKVTPGTYSVSLTKSGYISSQLAAPPAAVSQLTTPTTNVVVTAGGSSPISFQYDQQATFNVNYASNYTANPVKLPTSLATTFLTSAGIQKSVATPAATQFLFPYTEGYSTVAGGYVTGASATSGCQSIDPVAWSAGAVNGVNMAAGVRPATGVAAGSTGPIGVPMGIVAVTWPALNTATSISLQSVAAPAGTGDPGCFAAPKYSYTFSTIPAPGSVVYLAVPFGSYSAYSLLGSVQTLLTGTTVALNASQGEVTGNVITLDPRNPA